MTKEQFIIYLYEEKDKLDEKLHVENIKCGRQECWAQINLLDKIIKKVKEEL